MSARILILAALLSAGIACRYQPSPVTLRGSPPEIAALAGEWGGEYGGAQSGRSGSISLRITAGGDTAYGDVVMVGNTGQRQSPRTGIGSTSRTRARSTCSGSASCASPRDG